MIPSGAVPFATQKADGRSVVATLENIKNGYAQINPPGSESPISVVFTPGLRPYCNITSANRIMGGVVVNGDPYVATPKGLYKIQQNAFSKLGDHSLVGTRASMAHNGKHILYCDGFSVYGYTIATGILKKLDLKPSNTCAAADGYFIVHEKNTNIWRVSEPNSLTFPSLDFASAEGTPDAIQSILVDHREVWIFKPEATEVWYNSGGDFPYQRLQGGFIEKGIASPYCFTKANNTVYWVGQDRIVYQASGYTPEPISSDSAIEDFIAGVDMSEAWMDTYTQEGHTFIWLCVPSTNLSVAYDTSTGLWHDRTNINDIRHRANTFLSVNNLTLVGDYKTGNVFRFDLDYAWDDDELIEREVTLPPLFGDGNRQRNASFELRMQNSSGQLSVPERNNIQVWTADTLCVTADADPVVNVKPLVATADGFNPDQEECCPGIPTPAEMPMVGLACTDNDGARWTPYKWIPAAQLGNYNMRWKWHKLGSYFKRSYRLRIVAPITGVWSGAYIG